MKIYDDVKLNTELEDLAERGIHKGCLGIVFEIKADGVWVVFFNKSNRGDYAYVKVNEQYLDVLDLKYGKDINGWEKFRSKTKLKTEFKINPYKEFDWVEILVEKKEYAKVGLHKGMLANVLFDYAIDDEIAVMFPGDDGYDVEVNVNLDDIKLCD